MPAAPVRPHAAAFRLAVLWGWRVQDAESVELENKWMIGKVVPLLAPPARASVLKKLTNKCI